MKWILACAALTLLSACSDSASVMHPKVLPEELADCKFYDVFTNQQNIYIVRCPDSVVGTSFRDGKYQKYSITMSQPPMSDASQAEEQKKQAIREALSKLTPEDRQVLGLN